MEILVDVLTKAMAVASSSVNVPQELKSHLQEALDIAGGLDNYLEEMSTPESEPLAELYRCHIQVSRSESCRFNLI